MNKGYLVTDASDNEYRVMSQSITNAINKVVQEQDLMESDIKSATLTGEISSLGL